MAMLRNYTIPNCTITTQPTSDSVLFAANVALSIVFAVVAILSVLSNALVIACVAKTPNLQRPANLLLCSLSLSDLLSGLVVHPLYATTRLMKINVSVSICVYELTWNIYSFLSMVFMGASFVQLCLVSWDRYKAVSNPMIYRTKISKCKTLRAVAVTWSSWIAVTVIINLVIAPPVSDYSLIVVGTVFIAFPVASVVATYKAILRHNQQIVATDSQVVAAALAREKKVAVTLRYVVGALFGSLAVPVAVYTALISVKKDAIGEYEIMPWAMVFVFTNFCINPVIYFLRHPDMRTAAFAVLGH